MPGNPDKDQLREYAEKWLNGDITPAEKAIFEQWYNETAPNAVNWGISEPEGDLKNRIFNKLQDEIRLQPEDLPAIEKFTAGGWKIAAVAALVILALSIYFLTGKQGDLPRQKNNPELVSAAPKILDQTTAYTRHLNLPDGSTVVLKANSKLDYAGSFNGKSREVILVGEAYFDVKHDASHPFIIHTGDIKTTVLGTAFNINANAAQKKIIIAVTRGKVKVENNTRLIAVLKPNEQVICNIQSASEEQQPVNAEAVVFDWTKQDMVFEDLSFKDIVQLLNRRYGVNISFQNKAMESCTIKAFFSGIESLDKVLDVLCIISNSTYTMADNKNYVLNGKGCE
jgi:transmembrane sensor